MSQGNVKWEKKDGYAVVTIDNPPVNALNATVIGELEKVFDQLAEEEGILAVILAGGGEKAFVAGADISEFPSLKKEDGVRLAKRGQAVFQKIADFPYPVICAIDGFALGGGLELAIACDMRVADEKAKLGVPEITLGVIPGYGGTQRLPRTLAQGKAREMVFTGDMVDANEAYRIGLVDRLVEQGKALDEATKLAEVIASRAPVALRVAKRVIKEGIEMTLKDGLNTEAEGFGELCDTEDKNEGAQAFFEKRKPEFKGK